MAFEPIQSLVRAAAERFATRVAIECPQGDLTYGELEARSDQVAADLRAAGAGPSCIVPVLADDRRELVAALLGVLKIGGVFVPLDLSAPALRLRSMLATTAAEWMVVGAGVRARAGQLADEALPAARRLEVDLSLPAVGGKPDEDYVPHGDDAAYIFFTSGSTGEPKAIVGRLKSLDHYIRWERDLLGTDSGWRVSQLASPAFDAMLRDVFVPLVSGGTVCVPPAGITLDGAALTRWIDEQRIELVHCVPSVFRGIAAAVASDPTTGLAALRCVATAGEPLSPADAALWFDRFDGRVPLLNLYGPSETTMTKTFHFVTRQDTTRASVPVGKAMDGARVVVLDGRGKPCPEGIIGEVYIRTPYLSLGYYQQPDATLRAFVPNPLGSDPDDIVYRTGDYGRTLPDGSLEFAGRRDNQVKIGGVRVELGEVESVLRSHPAVREAAVVVADAGGELPYLCAFVELEREIEPDEVRGHLTPRLADSVIPQVFVPVEAMPRTISGKIDRRALPAPVLTQARSAREYVAPSTSTQEALTRIWAELLPVEKIGIRHEFFEVGGHSLLVMRLLSRITEEFGVEVRLQEFIGAPTIEALADRVETAILADSAEFDDLLESVADLDEEEAERLLAQGEGN